MWIELPIVCHTESSQSSQELRDIGIDIEEEYEVREGLINLDFVCSIYPSNIKGRSIVETPNTNFIIDLDIKSIKELINEEE